MRPSRRRLLTCLGAGVAGLAGCLGGNTGGTGTSTTGTDGDTVTTTDGSVDGQRTVDPDHERGVWGYRTDGAVRLGPAAVDGTVYVGTAAGTLHALDPAGRPRWTYDAGASFYNPIGADRSPVVVDADSRRVVLFVSGDRSGPHGDGFALHAVDGDSGEGLWTHAAGGLKFLTLLGVADGRAYVGTSDDAIAPEGEELRAVSVADGSTDWTVEAGDGRGTAVRDGTVALATYGALAVVGTDGEGSWSATIEGTPLDPAILDGTVVSGSRSPDRSVAVGYAAGDGTERWRVGEEFFVSSLQSSGDAGFVGGEHVVAVGPDGTERWRYEPGALVTRCPVVGGTLYAGSGTVVALDAATGDPRWRFSSPAEYGSAVAVGDGRVVVDRQGSPAVDVVADGDGSRLFAFEGSGDAELPATALGETVVVADGEGTVVALR